MGTVSGMRYKATTALIAQLVDIKGKIKSTLDTTISRKDDVLRVYDGEAARNYISNLEKISVTIQDTLEKIVKELSEEAEETLKKYQEQEEALKQNIESTTA